MKNVLHMIWLGGMPPLRVRHNLHRIACLYARRPATGPAVQSSTHHPSSTRPYLPLLWLDSASHDALLGDHTDGWCEVAPATVPSDWREGASALGDLLPYCRWLHITGHGEPMPLPCLVYDEVRDLLALPWQDHADIDEQLTLLQRRRPAAYATLSQRFWAGNGGASQSHLPAAGEQGEIFAHLSLLIDHARTSWHDHGMLSIASDLLRLLALVRLPGAYLDCANLAGCLLRLPDETNVRSDISPFCARQGLAIENDIIFCQQPALMKSIAYGAYLWSVRSVRGAASRLGLRPADERPPSQLLADVLPRLDARLPPLPDVRRLFAPPYLRLANFICRAYRGPLMFAEVDDLPAFLGPHRQKEFLINDIGGLTGYQLFAASLAPGSASSWAACAGEFGLADYSRRTGRDVPGFGLLENLIDCGGQIRPDGSAPPLAEAEIHRLASQLAIESTRLRDLAFFSARAHALLQTAAQEPLRRASCLHHLRRLASALPPA